MSNSTSMVGKRILFIDRDGTLINEAPPTYQLDSFDKLSFYPHMFEFMGRIARELEYELVMKSLEGEGIHFSAVHIDKTFPKDHAPTRKPGTGMLTGYMNNPGYDIPNSFVIGDRITDIQLAKNLGCRGIWLNNDGSLGAGEMAKQANALQTD